MKARVVLLLTVCMCGVALWRARSEKPVARAVVAVQVSVTEQDVLLWREVFLDSFWDPPIADWSDHLWEAQLAVLQSRAVDRATALLLGYLGRSFPSRRAKQDFLRSEMEKLKAKFWREPEDPSRWREN